MRKNSLQTRFFWIFLAVLICVSCLVTWFFYQYTSAILIERETNSLQDLLASNLSQTEKHITDIDNISITIGYSSIIKDNLGETFDLDVFSPQFQTISQTLVAVNGVGVVADQINLYDFNGNALQVGLKTNATKGDITQSPLYPTIMSLKGRKLVTSPYYTNNLSANPISADWYLSLYRIYKNKYGETTGIIEIIKRSQPVFKIMDAYTRGDSERSIHIYDQTGALLYPYKDADYTPPYDYYALCQDNKGSLIHPYTDETEQEIVVHQTSSYTGWTYIAAQPLEKTLAPVRQLFYYILAAFAVFILLAIILAYYLSRGLTKPIQEFSTLIEETSLDTLGRQDTQLLQAPFEEFSELIATFQSMSVNLKTSMEETIEARQQEMKSRQIALQTQINPHFYYNTLSGLIVLAENGQTEDIAIICRNLTSIMRYITNSQNQQVTLQEELDYIDKYLYCMKVRYQDSLNYTIAIPPQLLNENIPKLIVQPLVENAVKYGTNSLPPWQIDIKGYCDEKQWYIEVIDSGSGFTPSAINSINEKIALATQRTGIVDMEIDGMGLLNVYMRWSLHCQDDTIFTYGNTPDGHGVVTIGRYYNSERKDNNG